MSATTTRRVVAVDLGATSRTGDGRPRSVCGRARAGRGAPLPERRGWNVGGSLHWDVLGLHREILTGLRLAAAGGPVHGIGIDSWAVDYGLLDAGEHLLGNPFSYRDSRTDGVAAHVLGRGRRRGECTPSPVHEQLPFNTIYQLAAASGTAALGAGVHAAAAARPARLLAHRPDR